jgi:4-amino-4-deoxy-L-arabinose transferase-like glycosyltransferase
MTQLRSLRWPWFITLLITAAYLPFLDLRMLRMAGDEKVYISQAIEMARGGRWFIQTLADQPDYYKGPLHYILIRLGLLIFGDHLIAGTYMNWLLPLAAALALYRMARSAGWKEDRAGLLALAAALNIGIWTHALASQMETELTALYGLAAAALGMEALSGGPRQRKGITADALRDLPFWIIAGLAGWVKSPLHAALLGSGALLFWFSIGKLGQRLRTPGAWLAVFAGIAFCGMGYAPAYFLDRENFMGIFIGRENVGKPSNGRGVGFVLESLPHFMFPWTPVVLGGLVLYVIRSVSRWKGFGIRIRQNLSKAKTAPLPADVVLSRLGFALALPTIIFFCSFPYKGQNYNLPTLPLLALTGFALFPGGVPRWSHRIAGALIGIAFLILCALYARFHYFNPWVIPALVLAVVSAALFLTGTGARSAAVAAALFFGAFGAVITPLGQWEMQGVKRFVNEHPSAVIHYYNLEPTIWSEWGILQLVLHKPVQGVHRVGQLAGALQPGHALLVPGAEALGALQEHAKRAGVSLDGVTHKSWPRWMTKGRNSQGQTLWSVAWSRGDLSVLQREFYILWRN